MKKVEEVIRQLSNLYEFNKKLKAYKLQNSNNINAISQQPAQPDREDLGSVVGKVISAAG